MKKIKDNVSGVLIFMAIVGVLYLIAEIVY